jgi:hypothetical protein
VQNPRILLVYFFALTVLLSGKPVDAITIKRDILFRIDTIQHTYDSEPNTYETLTEGNNKEFLWQFDSSETEHAYPYKYIWSLNDSFRLSFEYEDDRYEDDEHEDDEHEDDEHEDDEHEDDEHEDDELITRAKISFSLFEMGEGFDEINEALALMPLLNPEYWLREREGMNINNRKESLTMRFLPTDSGLKKLFLTGNYDSGDWAGSIHFFDKNYKAVTLGVSSTLVPEPSTVILLGSGLIGLVLFGRKRKR